MAADPEELRRRLDWARAEAHRLRSNASAYRSFGEVGKGIEFLKQNAGARSSLYTTAVALKVHPGGQMSAVADLLDGWADLVEQGLIEEPPELAPRLTAATDLMEQVQVLLGDAQVHPAAPVMLAGAALEEYLRGLVLANEVKVTGKPGLTTYAAALRSADLLSQQDVKDVTAIAGTRNDAAHGDFDKVDGARARVMADLVNLFLRQKAGS